MRFSNAIEYSLRHLRLTQAGKIRLTPFSEKVINYANKRMLKDYKDMPRNPYSVFYGICYYMAGDLGESIEWSRMAEYITFSKETPVTEKSELFKGDVTIAVRDLYKNMKGNSKSNSNTKKGNKTSGRSVIFNEGLTYWKHGKEYKYPDQAIDQEDIEENVGPCRKDPNPKLTQDDKRRKDLDPVEELKKALRTGRVNIAGLKEMHAKWKNLCPPVYKFSTYYFKEVDIDDHKT